MQRSIDFFFADIRGIFKSEYYVQQFFPEKQSFDTIKVKEKFCEFSKKSHLSIISPSTKPQVSFLFSTFFSSGLNVRSFKFLIILKGIVSSIKPDHVKWPL